MSEKVVTKFHAMQLFTDTFIAETVHLSNQELGMYTRLLNFHWTKNAKPITTHQARTICQCKTAECEFTVDNILREFFVPKGMSEDGTQYWVNKRVVEEYQYLTDKYAKRSRAGKLGAIAKHSANGKTMTPIPNPNPKPNKYNYCDSFEELWDKLDIRRGAKYNAHKEFIKLEGDGDLTIEFLAETYNRQMKDVDVKFVPHFSTWLHQRRWEIDEKDERKSDSATIIEKMTRLGFVFTHSEDNFNYFKKDNKQYKIDRYDKEHMILDA